MTIILVLNEPIKNKMKQIKEIAINEKIIAFY